MSAVRIEPASASHFDDVQYALSGGGDGRSCQCQWWMMRSSEWDGTTKAERQERLRSEMHADLAPGLVLYVDDVAAGFVRVGPRATHVRLAHSRKIAPLSTQSWEDPDVWTVSCFVVRSEFRSLGLTALLLDEAIEYSRSHGARAIEAYPVDVSGGKWRSNELFHGTLATFIAAGFHEVARPRPTHVMVLLDFSQTYPVPPTASSARPAGNMARGTTSPIWSST